MANYTDISKNQLLITNPSAIFVTPFSDANTKGGTTYKLDKVVKDSTSISQDDPEETKIENEFSSAPLVNGTKLGSYHFSAEVADMQSKLLEALCGYKKGTGSKTYAPATYVPVYAEIALTFKISAEKTVAAILPKVQLNSKATFDSLSSNIGRITLAGTGLNMAISGESGVTESPFYVDDNFTEPTAGA